MPQRGFLSTFNFQLSTFFCTFAANLGYYVQNSNKQLKIMVKQFKFWNTISGWLVFLVAALTYLLTMEPTASFWDCGEFISSAAKLDVGHPPGAPFFMLMGHFFSLFASSPGQIAACVTWCTEVGGWK